MKAERINFKDKQLAVIVYDSFEEPGIHFFTSNEESQQLAFMNHPKGKQIDPHIHNPVRREILYTQETIFVKSGKLRIDFYTDTQEFIESRVLTKGDVVLLMSGGHGFEVLEDVQMFEVKQGPYAGEIDKTRFKLK